MAANHQRHVHVFPGPRIDDLSKFEECYAFTPGWESISIQKSLEALIPALEVWLVLVRLWYHCWMWTRYLLCLFLRYLCIVVGVSLQDGRTESEGLNCLDSPLWSIYRQIENMAIQRTSSSFLICCALGKSHLLVWPCPMTGYYNSRKLPSHSTMTIDDDDFEDFTIQPSWDVTDNSSLSRPLTVRIHYRCV